MTKKVFFNILFAFLTAAILAAAALCAFATGKVLRKSYGEKSYDSATLNDPTASGIDVDLVIEPWDIYKKSIPTVGQILKNHPEYLTSDVSMSLLYEKAAAANNIVYGNKGITVLYCLCGALFNATDTYPEVDILFDERFMYDFLTDHVQMRTFGGYYNTFFIKDYRYTDKKGDEYILNAAVTYDNKYYFNVAPADGASLSVTRAADISRNVPKWVNEMTYETIYDASTGQAYVYDKRNDKYISPDELHLEENPIAVFNQVTYVVRELVEQGYISESHTVNPDYYISAAYYQENYYTALHDGQLLIVFPMEREYIDADYIMFYDPTLEKISGFALRISGEE